MKMPECEREDCRFIQKSGMSTLAYYQPIYLCSAKPRNL